MKVATVSGLAPGTVEEVRVSDHAYALCHVDGKITAIDGTCLHRGAPLGEGQVRDGYVICPWHAWGWHCETGANDYDPSRSVATYEVKVEGDDILLQVP